MGTVSGEAETRMPLVLARRRESGNDRVRSSSGRIRSNQQRSFCCRFSRRTLEDGLELEV